MTGTGSGGGQVFHWVRSPGRRPAVPHTLIMHTGCWRQVQTDTKHRGNGVNSLLKTGPGRYRKSITRDERNRAYRWQGSTGHGTL